MKSKLTFKWIDDDPLRRAVAKNLENRLGAHVEFIGVKNKDLEETLSDLVNKRQPDLVLIDHRLDGAQSDLFRTGFTSAAYIREKWPTCPIICVTGIDKDDYATHEHSLYQETYEINNISSHDDQIMSIAETFKYIRSRKFNTIDSLMTAIKVPKQDQFRFNTIIPHYVKENLDDNTLATNLCKWIRKTLFLRPGFLYDRLWTATFLGVKEESFKKIEDQFEAAKYQGLFHNNTDERWWKSDLLTILNSSVEGRGLPWELGRKLEGIKPRDYSKCYATSEDFPETVAYVDETIDAKRSPMRIKNTTAHPKFEDLLFFENIRMMKADD